MIVSRFVHAYRVNPACVALFHALTLETIVVPFPSDRENCDAKVVIASINDEEIIRRLKLSAFLVSSKNKDMKQLARLSSLNTGSVDISIIYLLLAERCNLRCKYCFIAPRTIQQKTASMSISTIDKTLKCVENWTEKDTPLTLQVYGGEPLLNPRGISFLLKTIARRITQKKIAQGTKVSIITNGTLITPSIATELAQYREFLDVAVSVDGPEEINDRNRRYANHKGSYQKVCRGINLLKQAGLKPTLSCTLTSENVDAIEQIVDWIAEFAPPAVSFNTITDTCQFSMDSIYAQKVSEAMLYAFRIFRDIGIYEDRVMRKVKAFVEKTLYPKDCAGYGNQIVIGYNGDIGVCHGYMESRKYFVANVHHIAGFDPRSNDVFIEWSRRSPLNMSECLDCPGIGICGGGCACNADRRTGSIWNLDTTFCPHTLATLEWMIKETFQQDEV